jgi:acyl-CoA synthetase (AMP-forming)/AMP-acid ligase II
MIQLTVGDLYDRAVRLGGDRVALAQGDRAVSYRELGEHAARLAGAFMALGLGRGDRVAFLMANCVEYVACEYAVARIGAVRVPLAVLLANDDHLYMMNFARCTTLVYHERLAARVLEMQPQLATVRHYICVADEPARVPAGHLHLQALLHAHEPASSAAKIDPEDLVGIYFTGGTTGRPKGVMLSHRSFVYTCYMELLDFGVGWHEIFVFTTPLTHAAGCMLLPVLLRQGRGVILDHFDPELLLATIERERATATLLVPTMLYSLLDHPRRDAFDLHSLRNVLYGAAAIAPERLKQAVETFGPVFTQFFGQTEAPMALTSLPRELHVVADRDRQAAVFSSAGMPTYPTRIRLLDDDGNEVSEGEPGEIVAHAPNVMSGYLDDPAATAEALRDGWLHTGDIARRDAEGYLTIVDRKKDMVVSGGFNVYPREIEDVLFEHPAVAQAAVIGVPHERWGEQVKALVVLRQGQSATERELIEFVKARKGSLTAPKSVEFVAAIPVTNLGKVDKKALRTRYWGGRPRNV